MLVQFYTIFALKISTLFLKKKYIMNLIMLIINNETVQLLAGNALHAEGNNNHAEVMESRLILNIVFTYRY